MKRDARIRRNLDDHAKRMRELIDSGMAVEAASKQAFQEIIHPTRQKAVQKAEYYACSCTVCGWQGTRTSKGMSKPCPKCKAKKVFPNNPNVSKAEA